MNHFFETYGDEIPFVMFFIVVCLFVYFGRDKKLPEPLPSSMQLHALWIERKLNYFDSIAEMQTLLNVVDQFEQMWFEDPNRIAEAARLRVLIKDKIAYYLHNNFN
jgi:hypothetical protein